MKPSKAIEILTILANRLAHISQADEQAAARLGIEALKHYQEVRPIQVSKYYPLLPGETPE